MLKDSFFTIKTAENDNEGNYHFVVCLKPEHTIFKGHFPEMPVVPGVCTIQMVKECLQSVSNEEYQILNIINCKFPGMIVPTMVKNLDIDINVALSEEGITMKSTVKSDEHKFLVIKATLKKEI
ncbi:MAG TPA: beta-hydroxyacyl-ACP dehydratase [Paludibacteraceae bacterium]|nr:beta-hydroxyacyl-ACP dehydratase [Paludibacteraceae bacterium]HOU69098.1 beta-hydroxyacyl-ACP dehydratase [Paludibacteraceae bacterium]HPH63719.1 beta-hydroxyacyl-ACP dehydratase [Paludibacteraceae bacterium]HQF50903.1 beta-hydroxyacyl-ACP dehydratase [Paludibacteraceae bacterium]